MWGNEGYIDDLGDATEKGFVKAVGFSNYNEKRLRDAYEQLKKRGIPLVSNQVNYSLIYRVPCDDLGITLIAYSPIAQGVLTGKYTPENPPTGPQRPNLYSRGHGMLRLLHVLVYLFVHQIPFLFSNL